MSLSFDFCRVVIVLLSKYVGFPLFAEAGVRLAAVQTRVMYLFLSFPLFAEAGVRLAACNRSLPGGSLPGGSGGGRFT